MEEKCREVNSNACAISKKCGMSSQTEEGRRNNHRSTVKLPFKKK